jgi:hypothetical protein
MIAIMEFGVEKLREISASKHTPSKGKRPKPAKYAIGYSAYVKLLGLSPKEQQDCLREVHAKSLEVDQMQRLIESARACRMVRLALVTYLCSMWRIKLQGSTGDKV